MLVLLLLLGGYLGHDRFRPDIEDWWALRNDPPLAGENRVGQLVLQQKDDNMWTVSGEYFYTGKPRHAIFVLESRSRVANAKELAIRMHSYRPAQRGLQKVSFDIVHPGHMYLSAVTESINAGLVTQRQNAAPTALAQVTLAQRIDWPDRATMNNRPEAVLARAVEAIEAGQYRDAKASLEGLVARDPKFDAAYRSSRASR
ncbi:hypothetical protein HK414_03915 [Ramlibacter terrae]|uniref:Uncharacterized protein n=1 Tax=Ramlibacter terrae TaxID=2732511 RepID=A0ABX6P2L1_9BURK|nr:hypothetical protein HK414_03915 [Ramlibacter terrae]